jgi:hypothetical protein
MHFVPRDGSQTAPSCPLYTAAGFTAPYKCVVERQENAGLSSDKYAPSLWYDPGVLHSSTNISTRVMVEIGIAFVLLVFAFKVVFSRSGHRRIWVNRYSEFVGFGSGLDQRRRGFYEVRQVYSKTLCIC